jgi:hypothetical protein
MRSAEVVQTWFQLQIWEWKEWRQNLLLSLEQQQLCLEDAQDMLGCANRDPELLKMVITDDESWVY